VGVEIGASLKNIIAIAAGVTESMNLGTTLAALITRGLAATSRLACAMGGRRESLAGLSGLGDLVLTYRIAQPQSPCRFRAGSRAQAR
jgi:glycerol-3-phosphate dehydrogenase (NAD(P)+)